MVYIYAVHKSEDTDVIEKVKCTNHFGIEQDIDKTKEFMIEFINVHPDSVKTMYKCGTSWYSGEYVHVVDNEYLRTDSNRIKADNLGNLIEY